MSSISDRTSIPIEEAIFVSESLQDDLGRVFTWRGEIYRAINFDAVEQVKELLSSGLIKELNEKGLFPVTSISDLKLQNYGLVLKHEKIEPLSYPYEWSYDMYKDAGLAMLKINKIARSYGYETKDCHAYNILFKGTHAQLVDLGSFQKLKAGQKSWVAYEQFVRTFVQPLKIWAKGDDLMASSILANMNTIVLPRASYWYYKRPFWRLFNYAKLSMFAQATFEFQRLDFTDPAKLKAKVPFGLGGLVLWLKSKGLLPFQKTNFNRQIRKLKGLDYRMNKSMWSSYHQNYEEHRTFYETDPRFSRLVEITKSLNIKTAIEIGGNQGAFSKLLVEKAGVQDVVCTDYDQKAVNALYNSLKKSEHAIHPMVYDFKYPRKESTFYKAADRFKGKDALYALAITHHLTITQKMSLDWIFGSIAAFESDYVFIEFMPLGLYNSKKPESTPAPPKWYNQEWFKKGFEKYFDLMEIEELKKNRVLFLGKRKK